MFKYKKKFKFIDGLKVPEYALHKQIADYLLFAIAEPDFWTSCEVSNHQGSTEGRIRQAQDKARGVKSGFPDIHLLKDGKGYYLEVKTKTGRLTPNQELIHRLLTQAGGQVAVVRSLEDVQEVLESWGFVLRGSVK